MKKLYHTILKNIAILFPSASQPYPHQIFLNVFNQKGSDKEAVVKQLPIELECLWKEKSKIKGSWSIPVQGLDS